MTNASPIRSAVALYNSGAPLLDVSKHLGVDTRTARTMLVACGVTIRRTGRPNTDTLAGYSLQEVLEMRRAGKTYYDLSKDLGMSTTAIGHFLRKNGHGAASNDNPITGDRQALIAKVVKLRDSSVTYKVIAQTLGVSQSTVWRIASTY